MPSKKLIAIVATVSLVVVGGGTAVAISAAVAEAVPLSVTGFADSATTIADIAKSTPTLTTVSIDGVNLDADGDSVSSPTSDALRLLDEAHARGKQSDLVVGNFDEKLGDFSSEAATALLSSRDNITTVVARLTAEVDKNGWDGITVDFEGLDKADAAGLTRFVRELHASLGSGRSVAVCLMATTGSYGNLGYQLASLAKYADRVVLMAYDEHDPSWSAAGPIGGAPWVTQVLAPVLQKVKPSKIELGVAGYGYRWPASGTGSQISDRKARSLVAADGAKAIWSAKQKEWHATLSDGTVLWWSDKRTFQARYALARQLHLHGVAVWSLSLSDPLKP